MRAYSQDLRERVLGALARGERLTNIVRRYEVSCLWVYQVHKRWEETGQRQSLPVGAYRHSRIAHKEPRIKQWIEATPDLTLRESSERLAAEGIGIKVSALWHQLNKWGLSFKKNAPRQRAVTRRRAAGTDRVET
jgi:transposase